MKRMIPACAAALLMVGAGAAEAQKKQGWQLNVPGSNVWVWSGGIGMGQGRLGAQVQSMTDDLRRFFGAPKGQGVLVQKVAKGSVAAKAGLKAGDVIVSVNGKPVSQATEIVTALATQIQGGKVTLKILRNRRQRTLQAKIAQHQNFNNLKKALRGLKALDALKDFNIHIPDIDIQIPDVQALLKGRPGWAGGWTSGKADKKLRKELETTRKRLRALEQRLRQLEKKRKNK